MRSVVDDLRRDNVRRVLTLDVPARIALALTLGDEDIERYMRASGKSHDEALRELSARHQAGRPPSCASSSGR